MTGPVCAIEANARELHVFFGGQTPKEAQEAQWACSGQTRVTPPDVANVCAWAAVREGPFVTEQTIAVDGRSW